MTSLGWQQRISSSLQWAFLSLICFSLLLFLFAGEWAGELFSLPRLSREAPVRDDKASVAYDFLDRIQDRQEKLTILSLEGRLQAFLIEQRPDATWPPRIRIALNGDQKIVLSGEKCFLSLHSDGQLGFCEDSSGYWFTLELLDSGLLRISTEADAGFEAAFVFEKASFDISLAQEKQNILPPHKECFEKLSRAKWWGRDILLQQLGEKKGLQERLEFTSTPGSSYILYLVAGDCIVWKEGRWTGAARTEGLPLAKITSLSDGIMHIEGWDESGANKYCMALALSPLLPIKTKASELIVTPKLRSKTQISCRVDKQYMILKEGDRLYLHNNLWKKDKRPLSVISLFAENGEELLFFEKIENQGEQKILKGFIINAPRNQRFPFELPVKQKSRLNNSSLKIQRRQGKESNGKN